MLYEFITMHRSEIIRRCQAKVKGRANPAVTQTENDHGVPMFLDQLVSELRLGLSSAEISETAIHNGRNLLAQGFTVSEVVHNYGDVCQAITGLAVEVTAPIATDDFRLLNRCLDDAIAGAVTEYTRQGQRNVDGEDTAIYARLETLAVAIQVRVETADIALSTIKSGTVGVGGSTGALLQRSLDEAQNLNARLVALLQAGARPIAAGLVPVEPATP